MWDPDAEWESDTPHTPPPNVLTHHFPLALPSAIIDGNCSEELDKALDSLEQDATEQADPTCSSSSETAKLSPGSKHSSSMALRPMDALNPVFAELRSKNEETRLRASYDLRDQVIAAHRGK